MNILQIIAYILCSIIGYIVIKFIYKNFFIPLKSIKRKQISEAKESKESKENNRTYFYTKRFNEII